MSSHVVTLTISPHKGSGSKKVQIATLFERLAGKEAVQRLLRRMGLDPRQFVIFSTFFIKVKSHLQLAYSIIIL